MAEPTTTPAHERPDAAPAADSQPAGRLDVEFRDLGRIGYEAAFALQRELHEAVRAGERGPVVLLLEHDPVVTVSKRDSAMANVIASPDLLERQGVAVCRTNRGGDVTYHGPGQLVVYPILPLQRFNLNVRQYVRLLEQVVIDTAATFGVRAHRDACAVGVWVGGNDPDAAEQLESTAGDSSCPTINNDSAKLAAVGVRVQRWVSMHGLALNVEPDMTHFNLIVPCGLAGRPVTSLAQLLGDRCPGMDQVKDALRDALATHLLRLSGAQLNDDPPPTPKPDDPHETPPL